MVAAALHIDSARTGVVMDHYIPSQGQRQSAGRRDRTLSAAPMAKKAVMHRQSPAFRWRSSMRDAQVDMNECKTSSRDNPQRPDGMMSKEVHLLAGSEMLVW